MSLTGAQPNPLDQAVKGAPSPNTSLAAVAASAASPSSPSPALASAIHESKRPSLTPSDDLESALPSSPSQIYLNLLILEASLRSQYLTLRARRRQHTFFLILLSLWITWFFYGLFLRPREDGKGIGGSVYWVVDMTEKVAFMGGILTLLLLWATGQWERGVRWPRRWVAVTNRGLRGMNLKIVVLRGPWWFRILEQCSLIFPYSSLFGRAHGCEFRVVDFPQDKKSSADHIRPGYKHRGGREEDVAPGGDAIKLLLLPKQFSPEFRENWELYRNEYWDRENERRAELRKLVKARQREIAKAQGGWLWWTGWRGWTNATSIAASHQDKNIHPNSRLSVPSANHSLRGAANQPKKRRPSSTYGGSHSRSSSRSSTVTPEPDEIRPLASASDSTTRGHRRVKSHLSTSSKHQRPLARSSSGYTEGGGDLNTTSNQVLDAHTLHKRSSTLSNASSSSANESEISERSTTSVSPGLSSSFRPRQRDLAMSGAESDDA